jgi:flagellar hook assembly protein FlgD
MTPSPVGRERLRSGGVALSFRVPAEGRATLEVYSVTGRRVRVADDQWSSVGSRTVMWNGTADDGAPVGSGVYIIRLLTTGGQRYAKLVVTD